MRTKKMKAIRLHEFGGPEVLRYEDAQSPNRRRVKCSFAFMRSASIHPTGTRAKE
jgi:hypothetical protein